MLELTKDNVHIQMVTPGGWMTLPNGMSVSALDGWSGFGYSLRPYVAPVLPPVTPEEARAAMQPITPRELRLTLLTIGISEDAVDAVLVNDPPGKIEWKWATSFSRMHRLIDAMGAVFHLPPYQIDDLWAYARTV